MKHLSTYINESLQLDVNEVLNDIVQRTMSSLPKFKNAEINANEHVIVFNFANGLRLIKDVTIISGRAEMSTDTLRYDMYDVQFNDVVKPAYALPSMLKRLIDANYLLTQNDINIVCKDLSKHFNAPCTWALRNNEGYVFTLESKDKTVECRLHVKTDKFEVVEYDSINKITGMNNASIKNLRDLAASFIDVYEDIVR